MKNRLWIMGSVVAFAVGFLSSGSEGAMNSAGHLLVADASEKTNRGHRDSVSSTANVGFATSITTDGINIYVANTFDQIIQKVVISTGAISTVAGTTGISGSADGMGTEALFNHPQGITTDGNNLFIADTSNCAIRKIDIFTGKVSTVAGTAGVCGSLDGTGPAAQFRAPSGITTDKTNLYVIDMNNGTIRKVEISSGVVTTLANSGAISGSSDGTETAARVNLVADITTDGTNIYIVDKGNNIIQQIVIATGEVIPLAGRAGILGATNGAKPAAHLGVNGTTTDGSNLYIADTYSGTIRKIVISTAEVSTLAGTAETFGLIDGIGSSARFSSVAGITTDGTNLYVVNNGNNAIRKIAIATGEVTTLSGRTEVSSATGGTISTR